MGFVERSGGRVEGIHRPKGFPGRSGDGLWQREATEEFQARE